MKKIFKTPCIIIQVIYVLYIIAEILKNNSNEEIELMYYNGELEKCISNFLESFLNKNTLYLNIFCLVFWINILTLLVKYT